MLDLLYVRSLFRPADLGGNRYPWEVTRRLAARGHRVRVVTPRPSGPLPAATGATLVTYPVSRGTPLGTFATNAAFSHLAVEREVARRRPDLIVLSSYETAYGHYALPGRSRGVPSLYIYHGRFLSDAVERLRGRTGLRGSAGRAVHAFSRHVERLALRSPRGVVAVSPFSRDEIADRVGRTEDVEVIPTGVDLDLFHPGSKEDARRRLGLAHDARVLVTVGRLAPVKRYDRAIDALGILRQRDPRSRLLIVGDGPEMASLRAHAKSRGLEGAVGFEGFRDGEELRDRLWAADAVLCTSEFENWSLALLEALAAGAPVVGVPRGGIVAMLRAVDERLLVDGDDPAAIASRVSALIDDPAALAGIAARGAELVAARYGWEAVVDRLAAYFAEHAAA